MAYLTAAHSNFGRYARRLTCGCKSPNCPHLVQHLFDAHRPIRRDANDEGPTDFLTCRRSINRTDRISVTGDRGRKYLRLRRETKALRDPLLGWVVAAKSATAGTHGTGSRFAPGELGLRVDVVPDPVGAGESEKSPPKWRIEVLHGQLACCLIGFWPRCPFRHCGGEFSGRGRREESTPQRARPNSPWGRNGSPGKARRGLD